MAFTLPPLSITPSLSLSTCSTNSDYRESPSRPNSPVIVQMFSPCSSSSSSSSSSFSLSSPSPASHSYPYTYPYSSPPISSSSASPSPCPSPPLRTRTLTRTPRSSCLEAPASSVDDDALFRAVVTKFHEHYRAQTHSSRALSLSDTKQLALQLKEKCLELFSQRERPLSRRDRPLSTPDSTLNANASTNASTNSNASANSNASTNANSNGNTSGHGRNQKKQQFSFAVSTIKMLPAIVERKQKKHTYVQISITSPAEKKILDALRDKCVATMIPGRQVLQMPDYHITLMFGCDEKDWERVANAIEQDLQSALDEKYTLGPPRIVSPANRDRDFVCVDINHSKLKTLKSVWHLAYSNKSRTEVVVPAHVTLLEISRASP